MMSDFYCEQVLSGKTPVRVVEETANVLAFHHTRPAYPVHIVVIPKRHVDSLLAVSAEDEELLTEMLRVIRSVAQSVVSSEQACRVITNLGKYQDSKHLHFHVVSGKTKVPAAE